MKRNFAKYLHWILLINVFLPIVSENDVLFIFGYRFNLLLWFLYLIVFYPKIFLTKPMKLIFFYILLYAYFAYKGHYEIDFLWFHKNISSIFIGISIYTYFLYKNDFKGLRKVIVISLIFISITSIISIIGNYIFPNASRFLVTPEGNSSPAGIMYKRMGIAGYGFASALPFIIPSLFYKYKQIKSKEKNIWLFLIILIFTYIYFAGYTAPLIVGGIGIIFSLIGAKKLKRNLYIILFTTIIILIIPRDFYANTFYSLSERVDNEIYKIRLADIGKAFDKGVNIEVHKGRTEAEHRLSRYKYNYEIFSKNVLTGSGSEGNFHLYWINILARYGIIGLIPLLLIIRNQVLLNKKLLNKDSFFYYIFAIVLFLLLGLMKAIQGKEMYVFVFLIIPGIFYVSFFKQHESSSITNKPNKKT